MLKQRLSLAAGIIGLGVMLSIPSLASPKAKATAKPVNDGREQCYMCHSEVKALKEGSKHAKLACSVCHEKTK